MKRFTLLSLFGLLVVALTAPAYAQIEWRGSGAIDSNYFYYRNIFKSPTMFGAVSDQTGSGSGSGVQSWNKNGQSYTNTRARLKLDAAAGKEVTGTMFFEMDASRWGETGEGNGKAGRWKADQTAVEVKNMFFTFGVPYSDSCPDYSETWCSARGCPARNGPCDRRCGSHLRFQTRPG